MSGTPEIGSGQHTLRGARTPAEDDVERKARVTVARHATDSEDCRQLLFALGLLKDPEVES